MSEERLKEIKKNIDLDFDVPSTNESIVIEDLYNEVVRLKKIIDKANLFIEIYLNNVDDIDVNMQVVKDILNKSNLTLEQLNGIENE